MPNKEYKSFPLTDFVAIDIETTGLDPDRESIIELGAVRFENGIITGKFSSLVHTKHKLPLFIVKLTGINDEDLKTAPKLEEALPEFMEFMGDSPIVGHNPDFDLGFINAKLPLLSMPQIKKQPFDTVTLSRILLPQLISHNLETVASFFNIDYDTLHRAVDDAILSGEIFLKLWKFGLTLDSSLIENLFFLSSGFNQPRLNEFLGFILTSSEKGMTSPVPTNPDYLVNFDNIVGKHEEAKLDFDIDTMVGELRSGSRISSVVPQFKEREIQQRMVKEVADALQSDRSLLIEAGTGTGKSFAYIIPAIYWAISNKTKVIISTNTKNLQEQLFFKDIPTVAKALPFKFKAALLKGMANYLCLRRLSNYLKSPLQLSHWDREGLLYLVIWAALTRSGDIVENTSFSRKRYASLWEKVRGDGFKCLGKKCQFFSKCFINRIRREQRDSQISVINHSLLLSDLQNTGGLLGEYGYVVLDEAHNLDKTAIDFMGASITIWDIRAILSELATHKPVIDGVIPSLVNRYIIFTRSNLPEKAKTQYDKLLGMIQKLSRISETFFNALTEEYENKFHWRSQPYPLKTRYTDSSDIFNEFILPEGSSFSKQLQKTSDHLSEFLAFFHNEGDELVQMQLREAEGEMLKLNEIIALFDLLLAPDDINSVFWVEAPSKPEGNDVKLCWAPLNVGELIYHEFIEKMNSIIFTSATLTVAGEFDYIIDRIGLNFHPPERVKEVRLGYQFNYDEQLKVCVPQFQPLPNSRQFTGSASSIIENISNNKGGILVLSTSYSMLNELYVLLRNSLERHGTLVLGQGISGSRSKITAQFKENKGSILLGTESFWEGVDIPGAALQVLVLLKLPFSVPTEPYVMAYSDWLKEKGEDPFTRYIVPEAVIKFRQGIGRLIRTETDLGVLVILDKRVIQKRYGLAFLDSLPTQAYAVRSLEELVGAVNEQLGGEE
ncbi:DEAD/DEAH box helicase [bacterium]|nr:DEAD/DEAH box helicase [bacterium]